MLIEAKNICFGYEKSKPILNNMSFGIDAGERAALVGPSGCGKSTLSLVLAGYLKPQSGEVLFDGSPLPRRGYCPVQLIYQHPEKAVNPRWRLKSTLNEAGTPDAEVLDALGIIPRWLGRYPAELSGGELQRFCLARALNPRTRFIIADEMSTMLDVITQAQLWEFTLRYTARHGIGILTVTHSLDLAECVCTRVIAFEDLQPLQYPSCNARLQNL